MQDVHQLTAVILCIRHVSSQIHFHQIEQPMTLDLPTSLHASKDFRSVWMMPCGGSLAVHQRWDTHGRVCVMAVQAVVRQYVESETVYQEQGAEGEHCAV